MKKYIWWKEITIGPFSDEQIEKLNFERIEILVDTLLQKDFPKAAPLTQSMRDFPNRPYIFERLDEE